MTITQILKYPSDLPHAHLYLDDVEEICKILKDALSEDPDRPNTVGPSVRFSTKDLQMDSLEDLEAHGGTTREFCLEVGEAEASLRISGFIKPHLELFGVRGDKWWAVYSRVRAVFDARQYTFKNAILRLPDWLKWSLYALLGFLALPLLEVVRDTLLARPL